MAYASNDEVDEHLKVMQYDGHIERRHEQRVHDAVEMIRHDGGIGGNQPFE